jgi:hypothetical protein
MVSPDLPFMSISQPPDQCHYVTLHVLGWIVLLAFITDVTRPPAAVRTGPTRHVLSSVSDDKRRYQRDVIPAKARMYIITSTHVCILLARSSLYIQLVLLARTRKNDWIAQGAYHTSLASFIFLPLILGVDYRGIHRYIYAMLHPMLTD